MGVCLEINDLRVCRRVWAPPRNGKLSVGGVGLGCQAVIGLEKSQYTPTLVTSLKGIYPEFQVIRGFSQKILADLLSYDQIHS